MMKEHPFKIWTPEGVKKISSIASTEAHLGEKVYLNEITIEDYWKQLSSYYKLRAKEAEKKNFILMEILTIKAFQDGIVSYLSEIQGLDYHEIVEVDTRRFNKIYPLCGLPKGL